MSWWSVLRKKAFDPSATRGANSRLLDLAMWIHYVNIFRSDQMHSRFLSLVSSLLAVRFYYLCNKGGKLVGLLYKKPFLFALLFSGTEAAFIGNAIWARAKRLLLGESSKVMNTTMDSKAVTPKTLYRSRKTSRSMEDSGSDDALTDNAHVKYEKIVCDVKRSERPSPVQKKTCRILAEKAKITKSEQEEILLRHGWTMGDWLCDEKWASGVGNKGQSYKGRESGKKGETLLQGREEGKITHSPSII